MSERIERFIKMAYKDLKSGKFQQDHPSEEEIACFLEGKLEKEAAGRMKKHLSACDQCAKLVSDDLLFTGLPGNDVPERVLEKVEGMISDRASGLSGSFLDIVLKFVDQGLEIVRTTGEVFSGRELIPADDFREGRSLQFGHDSAITKTLDELFVEIRAESHEYPLFNLVVTIRDNKSRSFVKDVRVTLFKDEREIESRIIEQGKVMFESIGPAVYALEISDSKRVLATVQLEVRRE